MANPRKPWFPFYVDDWRTSRSIGMMDAHAERAYLRLLIECWDSEDGGILNDDDLLAMVTRSGSRWPRIKEVVLRNFEIRDNKLFNLRLLDEMKKSSAVSDKRKKAAEKRWLEYANALQMESKQDAPEMHLVCQSQPQPQSQEETTLSNPPDSTLFDVKKPTKGALRVQAVEEAFDLYLTTFQRDGRLYKLTPPRRNIGTKRLEWLEPLCEGDVSVAKEFLAARIRAIAESKWHMGANPEGKKYIDWTDHIMNASKFEKWFHEEVDKARGGAR